MIFSWRILGEVLNALPYRLAIGSLNKPNNKNILKHTAKPEILDKICMRLIEGSSVCLSLCNDIRISPL